MSARATARRSAPAWAGDAAATQIRDDVERLGLLCDHQRLADELLVHLVREVRLERAPVERETYPCR